MGLKATLEETWSPLPCPPLEISIEGLEGKLLHVFDFGTWLWGWWGGDRNGTEGIQSGSR